MAHRFVVGKSSDLWGSTVRGPRAPRPTLDPPSHHGAVPGAVPGSSGKRVHGAIGSVQHAEGPRAPIAKRSRHALTVAIGMAPQPTPMDSHISLRVSKAITVFARHPHKRPRALHSDSDGSLDIEEIWKYWGRHHGVSKHHMLQFISEHAFNSEGHRRFLLRSDNEGRTWVSVTQSLRHFTRRRRRRGGPDASRTLATDPRGCDGDVLSISSGYSQEDDSTIAFQHPAAGTVEVKSEPSGSATGSQDPAVSPTQLDCKDEPPASGPWNRQLDAEMKCQQRSLVNGRCQTLQIQSRASLLQPLALACSTVSLSFLQRPTTSVTRSSQVT